MMLTDTEKLALADGFQGPRPGSNFLSLLCLQKDGIEVLGERIEELVRAGALVAVPRTDRMVAQIKGGDFGPYGKIPDIELTHDYFLRTTQ